MINKLLTVLAIAIFVFACTPPTDKTSQTITTVQEGVDDLKAVNDTTSTITPAPIAYSQPESVSGKAYVPTKQIYPIFLKDQGVVEHNAKPIYRNNQKGEQDILVYTKGKWTTVYKTNSLINPVIVNMQFLVAEKELTDSATINQIVDTLRSILLTPTTTQTHWITLPPLS